MKTRPLVLVLTAASLSAACQLVPVGPSELAARRSGESLAEYRVEDRTCRDTARVEATETESARTDLQQRYDAGYQDCMAGSVVAPDTTAKLQFVPPAPLLPPDLSPVVSSPPIIEPAGPDGVAVAPNILVEPPPLM